MAKFIYCVAVAKVCLLVPVCLPHWKESSMRAGLCLSPLSNGVSKTTVREISKDQLKRSKQRLLGESSLLLGCQPPSLVFWQRLQVRQRKGKLPSRRKGGFRDALIAGFEPGAAAGALNGSGIFYRIGHGAYFPFCP